MYDLYVQRLVKENHLNIIHFRLLTSVYPLRTKICESVLKSLSNTLNQTDAYPASFYLKSTRVFSLIPRNKYNIDLMLLYIQKGIGSSKYEIMMDAQYIAPSLYSCYYYGSPQNRNLAESLAQQLVEETEIGSSPLPKLYWAYYAGITYSRREIEREFINDFWNRIKYITKKVVQLSLKRGEQVPVVFPDSVIRIVRSYEAEGSLFAAVANTDLNNPELWNIIATTVFNCSKTKDVEALTQAAYFYSFAKCFSRSRRSYDQKYCYNYIRCKALIHLTEDSPVENFYIQDTAFYLCSPRSVFFSYIGDCTQPYFDLLAKWWKDIPIETREFIIDILSAKRDFVRKELRHRNINKV